MEREAARTPGPAEPASTPTSERTSPVPASAAAPERPTGRVRGSSHGSARRRGRRSWLPRVAVAGATALAVAAAGLVGLRVGEERQDGTLEVDARLGPSRGAPAPATSATVRVTATGIGRIVAVESESLPPLVNEREFYELWFVGPRDSSRRPNRVSAGTFHPDENGRTSVRLAVAAVPKDYPVVSLTREPRDGDPRPTGPEVLRSAR